MNENEPLRILHLDDDPAYQMMLANVIAGMNDLPGFELQLIQPTTLPETIQALIAGNYHVLLTDGEFTKPNSKSWILQENPQVDQQLHRTLRLITHQNLRSL